MKCLPICCLLAICGLISACNSGMSDKVPSGQLSAKMIHNPRTAQGLNVTEAANVPILVFPDTTHDFGMMSAGERAEHEFSFKNTGKSPLIITEASSSCGCTIPTFSHQPIPPGGSGTMKVLFSSAGKQGHILKSITVSSNAFPAVRILTITAEVKPESNQ